MILPLVPLLRSHRFGLVEMNSTERPSSFEVHATATPGHATDGNSELTEGCEVPVQRSQADTEVEGELGRGHILPFGKQQLQLLESRVLVADPSGGYADIVFFADEAAIAEVMAAEKISEVYHEFMGRWDGVEPMVYRVVQTYD